MKNKIINSINLIKKVLNKYPITNISVMIFSIIYIIYIDNEVKTLEPVIYFLSTFSFMSFLLETKYENNFKKHHIYLFILIPFIISILSKYEYITKTDLWVRFIIWYFISLFLLTIHYNYKKSKIKFGNYLISVFSNLIQVIITNVILIVGIIIITIIFDTLLLGGSNLDYLWKLMVLEMGFYFVPSIIYSFSNIVNPNKFIKMLINKVLFTLLLTSYLIIYTYILKIIITLNIPSNEIFRILSFLFIVSVPIYLMNKGLKSSKLINNVFAYLYIPFILLQIYSLSVRIIDFGITIPRYLGIILIIVEIIYTYIIITKKDEEKILHVIFTIITITLLIPFINCVDFSLINQSGRLIKYKDIDIYKAKGAYDYLNEFERGKNKINKYLTEEEIYKFENFYYDYIDHEIKYLDVSKQYESIDTSLYNKIYLLNSGYFYKEEDKYILKINDINYDITDTINKYINNINMIDEYFENNNEIILNDDKKLIITYLSISLFDNAEERYMIIDGFLLEK